MKKVFVDSSLKGHKGAEKHTEQPQQQKGRADPAHLAKLRRQATNRMGLGVRM